jgi:hypothetical protein
LAQVQNRDRGRREIVMSDLLYGASSRRRAVLRSPQYITASIVTPQSAWIPNIIKN